MGRRGARPVAIGANEMTRRTCQQFFGSLGVIFFVTLDASAQKVVEDVKKFTERECQWLHRNFLDECLNRDNFASSKCSTSPDLSMSTNRGMSALEPVLTVRIAGQIHAICQKTCESQRKIGYKEWRSSICRPLMK